MIIKIKNTRYFKTVMFFVYEGIYLLFIDAFNQYLLTRSFDISNYLMNNLVVFNIVWILLFFIFSVCKGSFFCNPVSLSRRSGSPGCIPHALHSLTSAYVLL